VDAGNAPRALADLTEATEINPKDAYGQIWLDISVSATERRSRLAQSVSSLDMNRWPAPIVRLFLGQLTPAAALQAADDLNGKKKAEQACEATFYAGEFLLRQDKQEAAKLFQHAVDDCPTQNIIERNSARTELKLLGNSH
jgi:lipoprotein NlpI